MELKKNSWHAKLYKMHNTYFPDSLCNYFWAVVLYVAIFPLEVVSMFSKDLRTSYHIGARVVISMLVWLVLLTPLTSIIDKEVTVSAYFYALFEFLFIAIATIAFVGALIGIIYAISTLSIKTSRKTSGPTLVGEWWRGFKGKYCPAINWK